MKKPLNIDYRDIVFDLSVFLNVSSNCYLLRKPTTATTAILPSSPDDNLRTCVENPSRYELIRTGTSNQSTPTTQRKEEEGAKDEDDVDDNFFLNDDNDDDIDVNDNFFLQIFFLQHFFFQIFFFKKKFLNKNLKKN